LLILGKVSLQARSQALVRHDVHAVRARAPLPLCVGPLWRSAASVCRAR
jgi:hypothetical protein